MKNRTFLGMNAGEWALSVGLGVIAVGVITWGFNIWMEG
jgi:hypothetical protein